MVSHICLGVKVLPCVMNTTKVFIRVDGSSRIGLGHIYRSLALAQMLDKQFIIQFYVKEIPPALAERIVKKFGYELIKITNGKDFLRELEKQSAPVIVVMDGYYFDENFQQATKATGAKLVSVDDIHEGHFASDAVINHAPSITPVDYSTEEYTSLYFGPDYALLRADYLRMTEKFARCEKLETVFVCMGGSDPQNITEEAIQLLAGQKSVTEAIVVTGAGYNSPEDITKTDVHGQLVIEHHHDIEDKKMITLMRRADFAIVPSSTILYEVMAARLPAITGYYVENQTKIYNGFEATGAVMGLGKLSKESIGKGISELTVKKAQKIQSKQKEVIDGESPKRIRRIFNQLIA